MVSGQRRCSVAYPSIVRSVRSGGSVAGAVARARQAVTGADGGRRRLRAVRAVARVRRERAAPARRVGARERAVRMPRGRRAPHHVLPLELLVGQGRRDVGRVVERLVGVVGVVAATVGGVVLPC